MADEDAEDTENDITFAPRGMTRQNSTLRDASISFERLNAEGRLNLLVKYHQANATLMDRLDKLEQVRSFIARSHSCTPTDSLAFARAS